MEEYHYEVQGTEQWRVIGGAVVLAVIIAAALWYFLVFRQPAAPTVFEQPTVSPETDALVSPDTLATPTPQLENTPISAAYVPPQAQTGASGYVAPVEQTAGTYDVTPSTPTGSGTTAAWLVTTAMAASWSSWQLARRR